MPPKLYALSAAALLVQMRLAATCAVMGFLAACTSHYGPSAYHHGARYTGPSRYYPPPGPSGDPWGPYIREASARYNVPDRWIREVMRQESDGQEQAVSSAGAMGLMQVMPDTYEELRQRYGLGSDPFEPHDNIMAGTAYIREMYDRYGAPGFLAAYNAGPYRLDDYLGGNGALPDETVNYVASIAPRLAGTARMTGPLAVYAQGDNAPSDIAAPVVQVAAPVRMLSRGGGTCDPDAAYDPDRPCTPAPVLAPAPPPDQAAFSVATAADLPAATTTTRAMPAPAAGGGEWAIQVGAFSSLTQARTAAAGVHDTLMDLLSAARIELLPTSPFGGRVLFRARLSNLSANAAAAACTRLATGQQPCMVVAPGETL